MSESMIERVAKAINTYCIGYFGGLPVILKRDRPRGDHPDVFGRDFETDEDAEEACQMLNARAAIEAMREPTESIVVAGVTYRLRTTIDGENHWPKDTANLWRCMVDVASSPPADT